MKIPRDAARLAALEIAAHPDVLIGAFMGLENALAVIGMLQLALEHPIAGRSRPAELTREVVRTLIVNLRSSGLDSVATIAELGNDPSARYADEDEPTEPPKPVRPNA